MTKSVPGRLNCPFQIVLRVCGTHEHGLILRWRQIDPVFQHSPVEVGKRTGIGFRCRESICYDLGKWKVSVHGLRGSVSEVRRSLRN